MNRLVERDAILVYAEAQLAVYTSVVALIERASPWDRHTGQRVFNLGKFRGLIAVKRQESEFVVSEREKKGIRDGK